MRYYIIFGITAILLVFILFFYKPNYLLKYSDQVTIEYDFKDEGYKWYYELSNNNLELKTEENNKWVFIPKSDGKTNITFIYKNTEGKQKYKIYYDFKIKGNKIYWINGSGDGLLDYPNPY